MSNIFIGALLLSIWYVTLFLGKNIGLSMILFVAPLTYYLIYILERNKKIENTKPKILIIPIVLLSSTYFIFNNNFFNTINIFAIPALIIVMILGLFNEKFELKLNLISKIIGVILTPISFISETFEKLRTYLEDTFKINIDAEKERKVKKVIKSIFVTLPVVLVITLLLSSADEIFGNIFIVILEKLLIIISKIKISTLFIRIILIICTFMYMSSFFDYIISRYESKEKEEKNIKEKDNFTIKMILTALDVIYLVFCYIQVKSLFMRNVDINYANYARQGFFQLMIVSVINLCTILIAKKSQNEKEVGTNKYINIMSLIMIGFTFIILMSSAVRMYFYESAYGYTLLRLLVYCALITEAVLLIPTILYIVDKKIDLPKIYFTIIIIAYLCMNFANFDNLIAKRNVDRYIEIGKIDMYYLKTETGTDAVNQIIRILDVNTNDKIKEQTRKYLESIYSEETVDFREFNISQFIAKKLIKSTPGLKINY